MKPRVATAPAQVLLAYCRQQLPAMTDLLTAMAEAESPSHHPEAQLPVQRLLCAELGRRGYAVRRIRSDGDTGDHLFAVPERRPRHRPLQLLIGHCDTVWPLGTLPSMPVMQRDGRLYGPGVYDMKGGLVQGLFALQALSAHDLEPPVTPVFFINSDEEIGSHDSEPIIHRLARIMERVFVLEPSLGPLGKLKTARKGVGRFRITVQGKAAHAGLDPDRGASAILELSHVIQELFGLNDPSRGITVNVGTIEGGLRPNVIAPESSAVVDVRVLHREDVPHVEAAIHALTATTPGTTLKISGKVGRPPMEHTPENRRLWEHARTAAAELGIEIDQGTAGGGSDGNFTNLASPTLDGLGAVGDGAHAAGEHVELARMPERAALLACLLMDPPATPLR